MQKLLSKKSAADYKPIELTEAEKSKHADHSDLLARQMRLKFAFTTDPSEQFEKLVKNGSLDKVMEANMRGEELSLQDVIEGRNSSPNPSAKKSQTQSPKRGSYRGAPASSPTKHEVGMNASAFKFSTAGIQEVDEDSVSDDNGDTKMRSEQKSCDSSLRTDTGISNTLSLQASNLSKYSFAPKPNPSSAMKKLRKPPMRKRSSSETNLHARHLNESQGKLSQTLSTDNDISPALSAAQSFKNARKLARDQISFITPALNHEKSTNGSAISCIASFKSSPQK